MRMLKITAVATALALAGALAGCATAPEIRLTRFNLGQPIARGQIAVEPLLPADRNSPEFQAYANIVGAALARQGFSEAPGLAASEQVAVMSVERVDREAGPRRSPFTIGIGGGFGGGGYRSGVGVGGGVAIPVGHARANVVTVTRLLVRIKRRSEGTVIWEGTAETAARTDAPEGQPTIIVQRLADALFRDFPGRSGEAITVK